MKKRLTIFILSAIILGLFVSCANEIPETSTTHTTQNSTTITTTHSTTVATQTEESSSTTSKPNEPTLPGIISTLQIFDGVDFGDRTFTFLMKYSGEDSEFNRYDTIYEIEPYGETIIALAAKERNELLETMFHCHIDAQYTIFPQTTLRSDLAANRDEYDIYAIDYLTAETYASDKLYNLHALSINFENPWWDNNYTNTYSVTKNGAPTLYAAVGDASLSAMNLTYGLVFNKNTYNSSAYASTDLYELVRQNQWTIDTFAEMVKTFSMDQNGGGIYYSEGDKIGWLSGQHAPNALFTASSLSIVQNINGNLTVAPQQNENTWQIALNQAITLWHEIPHESIAERNVAEALASGSILFASMALDELAYLQPHDGTFGIVPYPLYSEEQVHYTSFVLRGFSPYVVPISIRNPKQVGIFLDIFTAASAYTTKKAYTERGALEYLRDENAAEMLDYMIENRVYDPAYHFWPDYANELTAMMEKGENTLTAWNQRRAPRLHSEVDALITKILIGEN